MTQSQVQHPEGGRAASEFTYDRFMEQEGIPIYEDSCGTEDITQLPRKFWPRLGGPATFVELTGPRQSERGLFVAEIPGGKATEVQHHLYEQLILILQGRGLTEIWQEGQPKRTFEWAKGSLFAPPRNTYYRLISGSQQPAIFFAITSAARLMNALRDIDFVFTCKHVFRQYDGQGDYFNATDDRRPEGPYNRVLWYTNFIADVNEALVDPLEQKVAGGQITGYRMAGGFPNGHISQWPVGRYHKSHFHGPGAILVGLKGKGYVNLWHKQYGLRPWQDGFGDKVIHVEWGPNSIYSPPDGWFHQHMSTGKVPARHVACYGSSAIPMATQIDRSDTGGVFKPTSEGGPLINYEDEDPEVLRYFEERLRAEGVECTMPAVKYTPNPIVLTPEVGAALPRR